MQYLDIQNDMSKEWIAALSAMHNFTASRCGKSKDDPFVKDIVAEACHRFIKTMGGECPKQHLALLFVFCKWCRAEYYRKKCNTSETPYADIQDYSGNTFEESVEISDLARYSSEKPSVFVQECLDPYKAELEMEDLLEQVPQDKTDMVILELIVKGYSQDTIADVLQVHPSTVCRRLSRMRIAIAALL